MRIKTTIFCLFVLGIIQNVNAKSVLFKGYRFETNIITQRRGRLHDYRRGSRTFLKVLEGDEYSIIVKNPLPVRVAVAISVDGLNTIDGKHKRPDKSKKWIIEPHSSITLRGWQTGSKSLRRFYFTRKRNSYARWKEKYDRRNYTKNLGVIGVAYFWSSRELSYVLNPPQPFSTESEETKYIDKIREHRRKLSKKQRASARAGTGMGRNEYNLVRKVKFYYDTGMYSNRDVLKIYYEFDKYSRPLPFLKEDDGFTPDMYNSRKKGYPKPIISRSKKDNKKSFFEFLYSLFTS